MYSNIPLELRALPQWVVANSEHEDPRQRKVPLSPRTGRAASVLDPATWGTFEEACRTGMKSIGFVLTEWDPYTIIDLDNKPESPCTEAQWDRHQKILQYFQSYTERSTSGYGYHIVVRGKIPAGVHKDNVEVYSSARYMIFTGDIVNNLPISDQQPLLDLLYGEMSVAPVAELIDFEGDSTDQEILEMALNASNGDKADQLCRGEWEAMGYSSQSEADFALLSIFAFYTQDNEQVRRLFRMTALGKRDKAMKNDRYLNFALGKIRAEEPPPIDFDSFDAQPPAPAPEPEPAPAPEPLEFPPGLVGEIADYILRSAIRPVPEVALAGAIALTAGICARSYNVSGSGLNQYLILLAKTGAGKEGAVTGMDHLISACRPQVPMIDQFMGPSAFASGQALIKVLDERPCFVSVLGEFGLTLQQLCDPRAPAPTVMLKKVLLDLYSKSGFGKVLRSSVYSDTDKNTKMVPSPNVSIFGESTPETFFEGLDSTHISEGLIPRFSVIEYTGPRPPRNRNANVRPPEDLVARLIDLVTISLTTSNNNTCANVSISSEATTMLDAFDASCDARINEAGSDVDMQLWNRGHLKALKLAAVIAVGIDPHAPLITSEVAAWAIRFIEHDINIMASRFSEGEIGVGDHRHEADIRRAVEAFLEMTPAQRSQYKVPKSVAEAPVIPFHYLRRRLRLRAAFKNDRRGVVRALEESLKDMVKAEILLLVPTQQAIEKFGVRSELYVKGPTW